VHYIISWKGVFRYIASYRVIGKHVYTDIIRTTSRDAERCDLFDADLDLDLDCPEDSDAPRELWELALRLRLRRCDKYTI
jgi:hypothetical protein